MRLGCWVAAVVSIPAEDVSVPCWAFVCSSLGVPDFACGGPPTGGARYAETHARATERRKHLTAEIQPKCSVEQFLILSVCAGELAVGTMPEQNEAGVLGRGSRGHSGGRCKSTMLGGRV